MNKTPFEEACDVIKFYLKESDGGKKAEEFRKKFNHAIQFNEGNINASGLSPWPMYFGGS